MKEITLNPDGTLNIINPNKVYIFKICYIPSNNADYWINTSIGIKQHGFKLFKYLRFNTNTLLFDEPYIQYSCECGLKFAERNQDEYNINLYQFDSLNEFIQYHGRGEI